MTAPAQVRQPAPGVLELTIREGRKRQVRRMVEAVGHRVVELERVAFGPLGLRGLEPGKSRRLTKAEVERLRRLSEPGAERGGRTGAGRGSRALGRRREGSRSAAASALAQPRLLRLPFLCDPRRHDGAAGTIRRRMQLRALRGAITVEENEADAILSATEELMREVMERNSLEPDRMVSCIFTCTNDLDAEFPAVAARRLGLSSVPLLCAREIDVPGRAAAGDPAAAALLRRPGHASRGTCTCATPSRCAATSRERSDRPRVQRPPARHPRLPGGLHLRLRRRAREARLERDSLRSRTRRCSRRSRRTCAPSTAIRIRSGPRCASASPSAPACRPGASPSATAHASCCSPRRRRCSSPARRSSTPGRRSRCIRSWPRCRAPAPRPCR